jgi:hypothetical protein
MTLTRELPPGRELLPGGEVLPRREVLPGPARCPPPEPGRGEYWGRIKPRRGLRAHTCKTAPVCPARVPAPNL